MDDLGWELADQPERRLELGADQLVVRPEHVDHPVEVTPLPEVIGKVAGRVDRRPVRAAQHVAVLDPRGGEVEIEDLVLVRHGQSGELGEHPLHVPVPEEVGLPDEPVVRRPEVGEGRAEPV
ncbi:hypothetical protein DSECCO2_264120 [anaerobic digester metagenome]